VVNSNIALCLKENAPNLASCRPIVSTSAD